MGVALHLQCKFKIKIRFLHSPLENNMTNLQLAIENEIYWIKYLEWVYWEKPDSEKPESPIQKRIDEVCGTWNEK